MKYLLYFFGGEYRNRTDESEFCRLVPYHLAMSPIGAGDEARTRYLHLGKVALYQMSYARVLVPRAGVEPATRGFSVLCSTN